MPKHRDRPTDVAQAVAMREMCRPEKNSEEIKAFFERMIDEHIDLAEELMVVAKQLMRTEGVKVTRIDYLNGVVVTVVEDPFANPRELVLHSGLDSSLVVYEVAESEDST